MHVLNKENTSSITDFGLYRYRVMPFGLKNDGMTYQRLGNCIFAKLIKMTIKEYADDMEVKSRKVEDHVRDLAETFNVL